MESSEDDAGTANSASRRESARERDVGQAEDIDATSCFQQNTPEARASCGTPAMSEDNFDGDSVPSPSTQDVNTSTEAILDMIDEIVDGPGAPKRLTFVTRSILDTSNELASTSSSHEVDTVDIDPDTKSQELQEPQLPTPAISAKSDNIEPGVSDTLVECPPHSSTAEIVDTVNLQLQVISSVPESDPTPPLEQSVIQLQPESSLACPQAYNALGSSVEILQDSPSVSECDNLERTIKCVTSSDNCDTVTVESAESTSKDSSVSENKFASVEPQTRSPLRRRLVRPAPSDRRPDSTVSSTDDSHIIDVHTSGQPCSENIAKDVSSSSDAVPIVHGNVKPEEIRNVSEISICKAETSISTPKKIKLIRQKVTPLIHKKTVADIHTASSERDQCQSTSSDTLLLDQASSSENSGVISTTKSKTEDLRPETGNEQIMSTIEETSNSDESRTDKENEHSIESPSLSATNSEGLDINKVCEGQTKSPVRDSCVLESSKDLDRNAEESLDEKTDHSHELLEGKDAPVESKVEAVNASEVILSVRECKNQGTSRISDKIVEKALDYIPLHMNRSSPILQEETVCGSIAISTQDSEKAIAIKDEERKVPPIKLTLCSSNFAESCTSQTTSEEQSSVNKSNLITQDDSEAIKQVPKLTIKLSSIQSEEMKSPIPKLTIKPLKPPSEDEADIQSDNSQAIPSVTKINIKPIPKPLDKKNDNSSRNMITDEMCKTPIKEPIQSTITKLNIKPILKPPEKINDIHRKSSSSEISESEYSENDETTSTSDQASTSDQGSSDVVPKVTIKLGKPGTESEGKFYTEQNVPKLTIKGIHQNEKDDQDSMSKLKLVISQSEDKQAEKIPKLTIKTVSKSESQPLSPKLTIKPIKAPENVNKEGETSKTFSTNMDIKENTHVPKITIKPVTRSDIDTGSKTPKKSMVACDSPEHIPVVTKLNIKPILKPVDEGETSESLDDKVPVVSKLNIKPIVKPKDNEVDSSIDAVPKITKLNIKPLKNPEVDTSEKKDCDELKADTDENSIPVITKLNIKPIIKPAEEDAIKESENQSSEAGNSSDDNNDHIPVVTKLNIKPIVKRDETEDMPQSVISNDQNIPVVTKLNIKPLVKPDENVSPSSPKKEKNLDNMRNCAIPIVTKLNIKPVLKPEEMELNTPKDENAEKPVKNPPLVMKINMKARADSSLGDSVSHNEHACNNLSDNMSLVPKLTIKPVNHTGRDSPRQITSDKEERKYCKSDSDSFVTEKQSEFAHLNQSPNNCLGELEPASSNDEHCSKVSVEKIQVHEKSEQKSEGTKITKRNELLLTVAPSYDSRMENRKIQVHEVNDTNSSPLHVHTRINAYDVNSEPLKIHSPGKQKVSVQNCTLLKKLLETTKEDLGKRLEDSARLMSNCTFTPGKSASSEGVKNVENSEVHEAKQSTISKVSSEPSHDSDNNSRNLQDSVNNANRMPENLKVPSRDGLLRETNENLTQPLEISISEKVTNQTSGQDSPRIILKINKTDHGASAKIITEELVRPDTIQQSSHDNTLEMLNDKQNQKRQIAYNRRKHLEDSPSMPTGKRLRSSRIVENTEKSPIVRRNSGKRPPSTQISPQSKETELSVLETKRLKLGQLLCGNKPSLSISPVAARVTTSMTKTDVEIKDTSKTVNHTLINNENCSKNGNSKLHNILSNLQAKQAKQMQAMSFSESNCLEVPIIPSEVELNTSVGSDTVERVQNSHPKVQEMIINENSDFRDFGTATEDLSQDPLEVDNIKSAADSTNETFNIPKIVDLTPQPKKRGRPRKLPVSEGPKPVSLPVPALEERPQRSLRLTRERPAILAKPRGGRGRGRGARRQTATPPPDPAPLPSPPEDPSGTIDPTSARIKLPRMTEALDKMPSTCSTPLSSRRRRSSAAEMQLIETPDLKVGLDNSLSKDDDSDMKSPEAGSGRARGGRGRGGRGRTPRGRGRGRGGGRGAVYMKETMGIYGRVCGPATTTVQLFEEETCMMDDNATPAKPAHLLDEDSQSSVKSSTNESNKMKKSKFADLFDSNKVWTAADVKEYTWPPPEKPDVEHQIMMIQEQVAMFLGVKSFKRRYPELKRRTIGGEERDYVLSKAIVTEALCDLGITAVEASEVLDIMLSDYPHKYEEYRSHQRQRQLTEPQESAEVKAEEKVLKVELKLDSKLLESKPDLPKVDPEKTRQDLAAAAIASASEWNARTNLSRRGACADLQALSVLRRRPPPRSAGLHVRPPAGFYPHALLPGQYQHHYVRYTPDQLRYFPLNTVMSAPPAPPSPAHSSSESEGEWGSRCSSSDEDAHPAPKRKKLTKVKRISQNEGAGSSGASEVKAEGEVDTCRVCKLRLEANRKYTHERFLVCANCNAKLHPGCVELGPDTIRKCREYPWQCAECKSCCACRRPQDDDKMLFCDLCDRGFHIYCVGLTEVPQGRWHCVECAVCKSCGARTASGPSSVGPSSAGPSSAGASSAGASGAGAEAEWHHQTRRGPGGHKVYSHSLCTPCARAYRIGRYCPLCERSFIGPKGTMQLVICKLCDRQLHQECVRQAGGRLNVLDYTCGVCRRGGITSRAAAVRLAPRTIATLFMAKRRFNKYAHRQYLASRARPAADADEPDDDAAAD